MRRHHSLATRRRRRWIYASLLPSLVLLGCGTSPSSKKAPPDLAAGSASPDLAGNPGDAGNGSRDGGAGDLGASGPCPTLMAHVTWDGGAVCVDRYEAATVEIADGGATTPHAYDTPVDGLTVAAVVAQSIKPQGYISEVQAAAACQLAGKRLCTLTEWLAACQGPEHFTYPYGNTYIKGACNEGRATNPVNDCFGASASFDNMELNSSCCDDQPNTVAPGGMFSQCVSAWGVYDMHGNLHEWISTATGTGNGEFKGGYFVDATINGHGCLYVTTAHAQIYHDYSTGFRCCADSP